MTYIYTKCVNFFSTLSGLDKKTVDSCMNTYSKSSVLVVVAFASIMVCSAILSSCKKQDYTPVEQKRKVIVNADMDSDDCMAILYLMHAPNTEVIGITITGNGFMLPDQGVPIAMQVAKLGGGEDIPVSYGAINSIVPYGGFPEVWRIPAIDFFAHAGLPSITGLPSKMSSEELIISLVRGSATKVSILGVGPSTNIARALSIAPDIAKNIEEIVLMGGAFAPCEGNLVRIPPETVYEQTASYRAQITTSVEHNSAEYNIILDIGALSGILQSGVPLTLVPLNPCQEVPVNEGVLVPLKGTNTPIARFIVQVIEPLLNQKVPTYFWDPLAAAILADRSIGTDIRRQRITVDMGLDSTFGTTLVSPDGYVADVCYAVDTTRFYQSFINVIKNAQQ